MSGVEPAERPDNGNAQDVGEIVNPLHVFVPVKLSWLWHVAFLEIPLVIIQRWR